MCGKKTKTKINSKKKKKSIDTENRLLVTTGEGWGLGEMDEGNQKVRNIEKKTDIIKMVA